MNPKHYTIFIQWNGENDTYTATVPELPDCRAQGKNHEEAIKNVSAAIDLWIEAAERDGRPVPPPQYYTDTDE